ncbi:putative inorganic carbon transporter subunit DabA, partial [Staphylococcus hominis]|uniref:putative inorganic carbon transporter subunit DabA n=1 Tax=Staphylococcus hominis TaxID=1290 RepID=UPI003709BFDF
MISNLPLLRQRLAAEAIHIPHHTLFLPPQHKTSIHQLQSIYLPSLTSQPNKPFHILQQPMPPLTYHPNLQPLPQLPPLTHTQFKHPIPQPHPFPNHSTQIPPQSPLPRNPQFIIPQPTIT